MQSRPPACDGRLIRIDTDVQLCEHGQDCPAERWRTTDVILYIAAHVGHEPWWAE